MVRANLSVWLLQAQGEEARVEPDDRGSALRGPLHHRGWCVLLVWLSLVALAVEPVSAASLEYQVKAVLLVKIADQVEWPAETFPAQDSPLVIGVLGDDPFGSALEEAARNTQIQGRSITIRREAGPEALAGAHVVFLGDRDESDRRKALQYFRTLPILTLGEGDRFTSMGGGIRFFLSGNKLSFEVNLAATERAMLKVSSRLLRLDKVKISRDGLEVRP